MAKCEADQRRMKTVCKMLIYGILAVYTILLLQSPVTVSTYSAVVNLVGILLSTLGHIILRHFLRSLPDIRQTIITKLMIMLSYSNQAYMIHSPVVCAIKHLCGGLFVTVLENNYNYVCPLVSMKFLVRTPFIMSLLYLYVAKLLLELNPMKFNELDHEYWNVFCWSGLIFVNLLDITVQYLTCEYMGSAAVCQWLAADILDNESFKFKSSTVSPCPWYSVIPNVFLLPLFVLVTMSIFRGTYAKISAGQCCGSFDPGFKWSNISKIYRSSRGIWPIQPTFDRNQLDLKKNNLDSFPIANMMVEPKPKLYLYDSESPEIKNGIGDSLGSNVLLVQSICISNTCLVDVHSLKIQQTNDVHCTTTARLESTTEDVDYSNPNPETTSSDRIVTELRLKDEWVQEHTTDGHVSKYNIKREIIVEPGRLDQDYKVHRRGSAEVKFDLAMSKLCSSISGYATFLVSCIITVLWYIQFYGADKFTHEMLGRSTFILYLWLNWVLILSGKYPTKQILKRNFIGHIF